MAGRDDPMAELLPKNRTILERPYMEFRPFGVDEQRAKIRDVSGITVKANMDYLEEVASRTRGPDAAIGAVERLALLLNERIRDSAYHVTPSFLKSPWNSYSYEFVMYLAEFCISLSGDREFQFNVGKEKFISPPIQALGRPFTVPQIYKMFDHFGEKFARGSIRFGVGLVTDRTAVLRMKFTDRIYEQFGPYRKRCASLICSSAKSGLAAVPERVHGLGLATIKDRSCIADGEEYCEWEFEWAPSVRHRLTGMIKRLFASCGGR